MERTSTRSTFVVMVCTAASRLLGYVKIALVAALYGGGGQADAIWITFSIPNDLRKLFAEGAFSSAFIPVLSTTLVEDASGERARALARGLMTLQVLILLPIVVLAVLFPRPFVHLLLSFPDPALVDLSAGLFRWMFSYILMVSLAATAMAVLNSHRRFAVPALSPLMFSVAVIACVVLLRGRLGPYAMAIGVVVGGLAHLGFQIPAYVRLGYGVRPSSPFGNPDVRRALKLWAPFLVSASVFTVNQIVARFFASGLEEGGVSAITYAVTILQLPAGLFTASVMTVYFPAMSRQAASADTDGLRGTVSSGLQFLTVLLLPSAVFLIGFGREIIAAALQRGLFAQEGTAVASRVLTGYAAGLLSLGCYNYLQRFFYALHDYRRPMISAVLICAADIGLSLVLKETRLRVAGLAYANTIAFTAGFLYLGLAARRRLGRIGLRAWLPVAAKTVVASLPMVALLVGYRVWLPDFWRGGGKLGVAAVAVGVTAVCVLATLGMLLALRVSYVRDLLSRVRRAS